MYPPWTPPPPLLEGRSHHRCASHSPDILDCHAAVVGAGAKLFAMSQHTRLRGRRRASGRVVFHAHGHVHRQFSLPTTLPTRDMYCLTWHGYTQGARSKLQRRLGLGQSLHAAAVVQRCTSRVARARDFGRFFGGAASDGGCRHFNGWQTHGESTRGDPSAGQLSRGILENALEWRAATLTGQGCAKV